MRFRRAFSWSSRRNHSVWNAAPSLSSSEVRHPSDLLSVESPAPTSTAESPSLIARGPRSTTLFYRLQGMLTHEPPKRSF